MTREEAIKVVRNIYQTDAEKEALAVLIPELKESEDERIRKEIIEFIQWSEDRGMTRHDFHQAKRPSEWIAYLEKQEEQKPVEVHIDNPNIEKFDPNVKITTSDSSADDDELLYVCNKSYKIDYRDGKRDAEKKPAEWSEEDEKTINNACCWIAEYAGYLMDKNYDKASMLMSLTDKLKSLRPQPKQEWDELQSEFKNINEAFEDGKKEVIEHPERYGLQKFTEWSEYDEKNLYTAIYLVIAYQKTNGVTYWTKECKDWLESLRLRSCWKPSEEQMKALRECGECKRCVKELYEDIQKRYGTR